MESQTGDLMARMAVSVDSPAFSLERWLHKAPHKLKYSQTGNHKVAALVSAGDFIQLFIYVTAVFYTLVRPLHLKQTTAIVLASPIPLPWIHFMCCFQINPKIHIISGYLIK